MWILTIHVSVKCLKEELMGLLNFKYFNCLSPPFTKYLDLLSSTCHRSKLMHSCTNFTVIKSMKWVYFGEMKMYSLNSPFKRHFQGGKLSLSSVSEQPSAWPTVTYRCQQTEIKVSPTKNWALNVLETTEQEPPDCWDMKLSNGSTSHNAAVSKTWRGAATLVPRGNSKKQPAPFKHASDFPDCIARSTCSAY